jgi:hypothetical protein
MKTDLFQSWQVIVMHTKKTGSEAGKKSRFLLESGETPNEGGRFEIEFIRYFFHFLHMKNYLFEIQYCSTNSAKIPSRFTDKVPFLADLSVSKTHFTDKPAFLSDLSVNFWPL